MTVLEVGFYKKDSGIPSITYPEALDEALCFGWIDGVRTRIDNQRYKIRFTPRRKGSIWSQVNIDKVEALIAAGRMQPAGLRCFQERDVGKTNRYSFERNQVGFDEARERRFRERAAAWEFFQALPPSFRKTCTWWVMSAKQEATRDRRLGQLIEASAAGVRIDFMKSGGTKV